MIAHCCERGNTGPGLRRMFELGGNCRKQSIQYCESESAILTCLPIECRLNYGLCFCDIVIWFPAPGSMVRWTKCERLISSG